MTVQSGEQAGRLVLDAVPCFAGAHELVVFIRPFGQRYSQVTLLPQRLHSFMWAGRMHSVTDSVRFLAGLHFHFLQNSYEAAL